MKFKSCKQALEWYAVRRVNPISNLSTTEACMKIIAGEQVGGSENATDNITWADTIHTLVDIERILNRFPKHIQDMLITYGVHDKYTALEGGKKYNKNVTALSKHYEFLDRILGRFAAMLRGADYMQGRKKISQDYKLCA